MLLYLIGSIILAYFIAKTMSIKLENENEYLKNELVFIKSEHEKEISKYQERVYLLNDAFEQFKQGNK